MAAWGFSLSYLGRRLKHSALQDARGWTALFYASERGKQDRFRSLKTVKCWDQPQMMGAKVIPNILHDSRLDSCEFFLGSLKSSCNRSVKAGLTKINSGSHGYLLLSKHKGFNMAIFGKILGLWKLSPDNLTLHDFHNEKHACPFSSLP